VEASPACVEAELQPNQQKIRSTTANNTRSIDADVALVHATDSAAIFW
jgi:hypothetical protein